MPVVGVEPTRVISTRDFESPSSAIPTHRHIVFENILIIADSLRKIKMQFLFLLFLLKIANPLFFLGGMRVY